MLQQPDYFQVVLKHVPRVDEDVVSGLCFELGASGISENMVYTQPDLTYDAIPVTSPTLTLDVYFENVPDEDLSSEIQKRWPDIEFSVQQKPQQDWLEEWKKGFTSFQLFGPYWVVPSWLPTPREALIPLLIDPGMAFGTGTHATTRLASELITRTRRGGSFLDVGTGTGILMMVAKHECYAPVVGNDIDPIARDVARENLAQNKMDLQIANSSIEQISEMFDVVCANIIDGVLTKLKPALFKSLKPGGEMILSGILLEREDRFQREFLFDVEVIERITQDEWVAYRVRA